MTLTSYGYTGRITTTEMAQMANHLGFNYAVHGPDDMKVSIVTGQTRQVRLAPGIASGSSILDTNDANVILTLPNVASGSQWFLVGLRRVWGTTKATTFHYVAGTSARAIPSRPANPSVEDFHPLALVQVTAGQTVPTSIVDLRAIAANNGTLIAFDDLVRNFINDVGTVIYINGTEWLRTSSSAGVPSWSERGTVPTIASGNIGSYMDGWSLDAPGASYILREGRRRSAFLELRRQGGTIAIGSTGAIANHSVRLLDSGDRPVFTVIATGIYKNSGGGDYGCTLQINTSGHVVLVAGTPNADITYQEPNTNASWSLRVYAVWHTS